MDFVFRNWNSVSFSKLVEWVSGPDHRGMLSQTIVVSHTIETLIICYCIGS